MLSFREKIHRISLYVLQRKSSLHKKMALGSELEGSKRRNKSNHAQEEVCNMLLIITLISEQKPGN